jgi:SAM-dependent methyltransferase
VAQKRLGPKGVEVRPVENDLLPFDDESFDLVINRHESFSASEVKRVMRPGGRFVTQQVGGMNDFNLNATLGAPAPQFFHWCLAQAIDQLAGAGLEIVDTKESIGMMRFTDVRALVYYLKCIPWQIEDFSVEAYAERLGFIDDLVRRQGYFDSLNHRFFVVARKGDRACSFSS